MSALRVKSRLAAALAVLTLAGSAALAATPATATPAPPAASTESQKQEPATGRAPTGASGPAAAPAPAAEPKGRVVSRLTLSIRERPTSNSGYLGGIRPGTVIALSCKVVGQNVDGNDLWYLLGDGRPGYVAARYVENLSPVPYCR
ncbi:SH3 domain-containing protein [Streptomyces sp. NPDC096310]|uniref:SH3 domain-containing protein n=1 Tax=Streptomyces sp. NPDC096310 TaxID=3366082 RepID=UPI0038151527